MTPETDYRMQICNIVSEMLDNPDEYGIYGTTRAYDKLESLVSQARAEALNKSALKLIATQFYFWWAHQPGTNTYQGFDAWWEAEGERFVENLRALKEQQ